MDKVPIKTKPKIPLPSNITCGGVYVSKMFSSMGKMGDNIKRKNKYNRAPTLKPSSNVPSKWSDNGIVLIRQNTPPRIS